MIRGAFATTSCGNMIAVDRAGAHALASAPRAASSRLRPSRPPTPSSVKPKPSWMPGPNSAVMMISSEKPCEPSGIRVVMSPIALSRSRRRQLERAGVLPAVGVEEEVAAALDDAGVDREADAVRRLEAERTIDRPEVAGAVGRTRGPPAHADVLDDRLERPEHRAETGRAVIGSGLPRTRRRASGSRPNRAELHVQRQSQRQARAALEIEPVEVRDADAEAELDSHVLERHDVRDEAVGSPGAESKRPPMRSPSAKILSASSFSTPMATSPEPSSKRAPSGGRA